MEIINCGYDAYKRKSREGRVEMKISEIISIEEIKKWKKNDNILIQAGTGMGKSYFIGNKLYQYCQDHNKKILFLVHRNSLRRQLSFDNRNKDINMMSYQFLECNDVPLDYDYIVCDEFHYFLDDSPMNYQTHISFEKVMNTDATKIFMSATPRDILNYMKGEDIKMKEYYIETDFDYIKDLNFIYGVNDIKDIIAQKIALGEKVLVFTTSGRDILKSIYRTFKDDTMVYVSKNNSLYEEYVDEELIDQMLKTGKLPKKILLATSVIDAGVSIWDKDVKTIILDVPNDNTLIQSLGRKRFNNKEEKISVYCKMRNQRDISRSIIKVKNNIDKSTYYKEHGVEKYLIKYGATHLTEPVKLKYDEETNSLKVFFNPLYEERLKVDLAYYNKLREDDMIEENYAKHISKILKQKEYKIIPRTKNNYAKNSTQDKMAKEYKLLVDLLKEGELEEENFLEIKRVIEKYSKGKATLPKINKRLKELGLEYEIKHKTKSVNGKNKRIKIVQKIN